MHHLDLSGKQIGSIRVLSHIGTSHDGRALWDCLCSCGNRFVASSGTLRRSKQCKHCTNLIDLHGVRFGKLTVIKHLYDESMTHLWECKCDCGNTAIYSSQSLLRGKAITCGHCPINTYSICNDYAIGKTSSGAEFLLDIDDLERVKERNWYITSKGYVVSDSGGEHTHLHRFVLDAPVEFLVDHINRNKSDCRKSNLRLVSNQENCCNSPANKNNLSTGHKNVYAVEGRYRVIIRKNGKAVNFGYYDTLSEAISVANQKRKELFGDYAYYDPYVENGGDSN